MSSEMPECNTVALNNSSFCQRCGTKLQIPPSHKSQIVLLIAGAFIISAGLLYGYKALMFFSPDNKAHPRVAPLISHES